MKDLQVTLLSLHGGPNQNGKTRPMARPRKTLLERVLANSFRPRRYAHLLLEPLPPRSPFRGRRGTALWREPHAIKRRAWQEPEYLAEQAQDFSRIVSALHGRPLPRRYRKREERRMRVLAARLGMPPRERPQTSYADEIDAVLRLLARWPSSTD